MIYLRRAVLVLLIFAALVVIFSLFLPSSFHMDRKIVIDADKELYIKYYELSVNLVHPGGLIIIDNVLWHGEVANSKKNDKFTNIIREFNKHVKDDKRTKQTILPLGDGFTVCQWQ